jgi:hypothetical protein
MTIQKWEYLHMTAFGASLDDRAALNELGEAGWELINAVPDSSLKSKDRGDGFRLLFKRPKA